MGAVLHGAPSISLGRPLRCGLPTLVAVVVVGLPGTMCFFGFVSAVGVITFRYVPVSDFVPGVGYVELLIY